MTLTLVTCLYDLSKRGSNQHRTVEWMIEHGDFVLKQPHHLVIFTEPELKDVLLDKRQGRPTTICTTPLEDLHEPCVGVIQENATRAKVTHEYIRLMWAKYAMLDGTLYNTEATHIGWIDFAIAHVGLRPPEGVDIFADPPDKPRVHVLRYFDKRDISIPDYWRNVHGDLAGGLVIGAADPMYQLIEDFWDATGLAMEHGLAPLDEGLLSYVVAQNPERYSFSYGDYADILTNHVRPQTGADHLLWQIADAQKRDRPEHVAALVAAIGDEPALAHVVKQTGRLLGLVFMCKDEAHGVRATLESFKPFIDFWTCYDTGSTDGTQDIVREVLAGIPGNLYEEPFIDFAQSRNRALDLHGEATTFTIMPDADDRLVRGDALRILLNMKRTTGEDGFMVNLRRGDLSYWLTIVLRTSARWRYTGSVHEVIASTPGSAPPLKIPAVQLVQDRPAQSTEATTKRWTRDLELLKIDLTKSPRDPRTLFYLAQTLECLSRPDEALVIYERRVEVGGWDEETFETKLRIAKILQAIKRPWAEVQDAYLDAHRFSPKRAEPLFKIAEHWYGKDAHALSFLFAQRAAALPRPDAKLFVDEDVYTWKAADIVAISGFYLGDAEKIEGAKAAERAVRHRPQDERIRANWAFYAPKASEMFAGYQSRSIDFTPTEPYVANNPSIFYDDFTGQWRCIVRTTNYRIINGQYLTPDDNVIYTRNFMLELNEDLSTNRAVEMFDKTCVPTSSYPVHGFEDCRLFARDGVLFCSSTVCDFDLDKADSGPREITLNELDDDYAIVKATPLRGPWSKLSQKNWMPTVDGEQFVYAACPFNTQVMPATMFRINWATRSIDPSSTFYGGGRLRGGSQLVPFDDGWLCIVHDVAWPGGNARIYLHRFVKFDKNFTIVSMTDPFYFERKGIEFCAGLAYDGHQLVASFGVEDRQAHFGAFSPVSVRANLRTNFVI